MLREAPTARSQASALHFTTNVAGRASWQALMIFLASPLALSVSCPPTIRKDSPGIHSDTVQSGLSHKHLSFRSAPERYARRVTRAPASTCNPGKVCGIRVSLTDAFWNPRCETAYRATENHLGGTHEVAQNCCCHVGSQPNAPVSLASPCAAGSRPGPLRSAVCGKACVAPLEDGGPASATWRRCDGK